MVFRRPVEFILGRRGSSQEAAKEVPWSVRLLPPASEPHPYLEMESEKHGLIWIGGNLNSQVQGHPNSEQAGIESEKKILKHPSKCVSHPPPISINHGTPIKQVLSREKRKKDTNEVPNKWNLATHKSWAHA